MAGLFGESPQEALRQRRMDRMGMLTAMGNVPLGTLGGGTAGLLLGEAIGALGGNDPTARAGLLQEAQREVMNQGLNPGDAGFTQAAVQALTRRGLLQEAQEAQIQGMEMERAGLELQRLRQSVGGDTGGDQRRFEGLVLAGVPPEVAQRMAPNVELFKSVMNNAFKKEDVPAQIQAYQFARQQGFEGTFMEYQTALKRAGASNVSVSVGEKPLSVSDLNKLRLPDGSPLPPGTTMNQAAAAGATAITAEEQAASTRRAQLEVGEAKEREEGIAAIDALRGADLSVGGVGELFTRPQEYQAMITRIAKAVAQKRNPGDAEAAGQAEDRLIETFPSFARLQAQPGALQGVLSVYENELRSGAPAGQKRRRRYNPQTGRLE